MYLLARRHRHLTSSIYNCKLVLAHTHARTHAVGANNLYTIQYNSDVSRCVTAEESAPYFQTYLTTCVPGADNQKFFVNQTQNGCVGSKSR